MEYCLSKIKDFIFDVQEAYERGMKPADIAELFDVDVEFIENTIKLFYGKQYE
jgi:uncharacterized protein YggL (DUF469 family)